ncbi:MAG: hypothetical protein B6D74_17935 [gamma proteobacterium symbiont of Ctena orbiculata]|nr:MAG: hypothetical protein B6D74_17935 [gamma proteobacterium symbiont of Ctena orbiculata]
MDKTDLYSAQVVNQRRICRLRSPHQALYLVHTEGSQKPYQIPLVDRETLFYTDVPVNLPDYLIQHFVCIRKIQLVFDWATIFQRLSMRESQ